jgi:hypothetical protein
MGPHRWHRGGGEPKKICMLVKRISTNKNLPVQTSNVQVVGAERVLRGVVDHQVT